MAVFPNLINFKLLFYLLLLVTTVLFLMPVQEQVDSLVNDKLAHAIIFLGLSWLIDLAYRNYKFLFVLALALLGYGFLIEVLQGFSGYRMFSVLDLIADIVGIACYALLKQVKLIKTF